MSTPLQKRANIVRQIDTRMRKTLENAQLLRQLQSNCNIHVFARLCRNLSAEAQKLSQKAEELLAHDKENGDA